MDKGLGTSTETIDLPVKVTFAEILGFDGSVRANNELNAPFVSFGLTLVWPMLLINIVADAFPERLVEVFLPN